MSLALALALVDGNHFVYMLNLVIVAWLTLQLILFRDLDVAACF